jgi:TolB-like protein/thioredoxin-like negative regulator of GroEL
MDGHTHTPVALEIAHVLLIDVVGYSKLSTANQNATVAKLNELVRDSEAIQAEEKSSRVLKIPTGDGMAVVFYRSAEAPVLCAVALSKALKKYPELQMRMGVHSGSVSGVIDVTGRANIAGAGINIAQRVMGCGDGGHILLSKQVADDLAEYEEWRPLLHDLGSCEVKHGLTIQLSSLWSDDVGNPEMPGKLRTQIEQRRRRWMSLAGAATLFIIVAGSLLWWRSTQRRLTVMDRSVAVLPFENLSEDKENAYFAGGVQDEILSDLAKVADLKVISRTSVMKYKSGPERNLRDIAKTLGVSHVVEGSVQRAGGRIRVVAQLIDARSDTHVWAEHYDRDFADIFAIQSEIAQRIADQLRAKLSDAEKSAITEQPTADLVAYAYYTKARELDLSVNWEGDEKNLEQEVELLEKAIQRDPNFALAYCALAKTHIDLSSALGEPENREHIELAKNAADAALRVRPDLGEAHLELARYYFYAFDYQRAREELAIVRRKLPNNAEALMIEAMIGRHENRWDNSLANLEKANDLDPRNDEVGFRLGQIYFEMRRYSEYEQHLRKRAASGIVDDLGTQVVLARIKLAQGDPVAAQSLLERVPLDFSPGDWIWDVRFTTALYLRDYEAASRVIAATPAKWANNAFGEQTSSWAEGQVARARGDQRKALAAFGAARKKLETNLGVKFAEAISVAEVATLDAGLGRKEEAIREARRAVELLPIDKDAVNGPRLIADLALVYAWTGERDLALEQLEKVVTIPGAFGTLPTYGDLRFNPCWDDLRSDPRFDKIVEAAKAATK